jgi:signal transduction histidine kinase
VAAADTTVGAGEFAGKLPPRHQGAGPLDVTRAMTDNFGDTTGRSITLEALDVGALRETLDRLRLEVAELHASRRRLVLAADTDRRSIERNLHEGVQQHLVALAVNLQLAGPLVAADRAAAKALLDEMRRDVQRALDETARLAQRIYPPLLEAGGLAAAVRSAAVSAGVPTSVEVAAGTSYAPEVAWTIYLCCLEALEHAGVEARAKVTVRDEEGTLAFEVVEVGAPLPNGPAYSDAGLARLRDRVEALGGRLTIASEPGGIRVSGSLPFSDDASRSPPGKGSRP